MLPTQYCGGRYLFLRGTECEEHQKTTAQQTHTHIYIHTCFRLSFN